MGLELLPFYCKFGMNRQISNFTIICDNFMGQSFENSSHIINDFKY